MKKLVWLSVLLFCCFFLLAGIGQAEENILHGRILAINQKFDFVIISLGAENGVKEGMIFMVHRQKKLLGKVQVEEVFPKMSSCLILPHWRQGRFRVDDGVVLE